MRSIMYKWRTIITGAAYVHRDIGSDIFGDGSSSSPFQSLRKALTLNPTTIICFGKFTEDMADGNHARTVRGDYMGAATFDGNDQYLIYGYTMINMIVRNCITGNAQLIVYTGSGLFAGVGRASSASNVGIALNVLGVAGSPVITENTGLYWGVIGGITAVSNNVFSKPRNNDTYLISLGSSGSNAILQKNTIYSCRIANRTKRITTATGLQFKYCIFADFDLFADDAGINFNYCLFLADSKWYYNGTEIVITGTSSADRYASLVAGMDSLSIPVESRPTFTNCMFSTQVSTDIFNNPEKCDFTIKPGSDADSDIQYGAMPVAKNIPILDNSNGVPETFDENTASGCLTVLDNNIMIDEFSGESEGSILSKIITINPLTTSINAFYSLFASKFNQLFSRLHNIDPITQSYSQGQTLPVGVYVVEGGVTYNSTTYGDNSIVHVTSTGTSFTDSVPSSQLHLISDMSNFDVIYIRVAFKVHSEILSTDGLQQGGIYLNFGAENITYRGRTIVPGESFMAENSVDTFSGSSGYKVGVLFDDTRAPSTPWIPAQMFGEYFEWRDGQTVRYDTRGIPISSGNDLSYQTVANGGYSDVLVKSPMSRRYFQIGIFLKKFR